MRPRVQGYLPQTVSAATVRAAIHRIMRGERVFADVAQPEDGASGALSPQEAVTLRYLAEGLRTREIARHMACCPRTVEVYLGHIYAKLGVSSRLER